METQQPQAKKFILNYGLVLGVVSILINVVMYVMNLHIEKNWITGILGFIAMITIIVIGINKFKQANGTYLTLGQALKIGIGISLVAAILGIIYQLIFMNYIEPDYMDKVMEIQYEKMIEQNPNMTQDQIDMSMEMAKKFSTPAITSAFALVGSLFFGLIISLVAGLIMKKENNHG